MLKSTFPLIAVLLVAVCKNSACRKGPKELFIENNNNEIASGNRYDPYQLQTLLDSLKHLDPRNTIITQSSIIEYIVYFYGYSGDDDNLNRNENGMLSFHTGSIKNWILYHAINIAAAVTKCANNLDVFVGIYYVGDNGRTFFTPVINISRANPVMSTWQVNNGIYIGNVLQRLESIEP